MGGKIKHLLGDLKDKAIGVFGLAFKQDTDDIRKSPSIDIIQLLLKEGAQIRCFDQNIPEETNRKIVDHISDINLPYTEHSRRYLLSEGI